MEDTARHNKTPSTVCSQPIGSVLTYAASKNDVHGTKNESAGTLTTTSNSEDCNNQSRAASKPKRKLRTFSL
jgi:hypothetical protein